MNKFIKQFTQTFLFWCPVVNLVTLFILLKVDFLGMRGYCEKWYSSFSKTILVGMIQGWGGVFLWVVFGLDV